MLIRADRDKCIGSGACVLAAPRVFDQDDDGIVTPLTDAPTPELEESARTVGASPARVLKDVTIPLIRFGLLASWLLVFMIFEREYSTGVYLLGQGTEVIGSMLVSLWSAGAIDQVAALSLINIGLVAIGLAVALRFGVRLHE